MPKKGLIKMRSALLDLEHLKIAVVALDQIEQVIMEAIESRTRLRQLCGALARRTREQKGITFAQMIQATGIKQSNLSFIETGKQWKGDPMFRQILGVLDGTLSLEDVA